MCVLGRMRGHGFSSRMRHAAERERHARAEKRAQRRHPDNRLQFAVHRLGQEGGIRHEVAQMQADGSRQRGEILNRHALRSAVKRDFQMPFHQVLLKIQDIRQSAFRALRRPVDDAAIEPHFRRAAAVEVTGRLRAIAQEQVLKLDKRHALGIAALAAVRHDHHMRCCSRRRRSLCVFVTSLHFLLDRRRTELAGNLRNITEIFLEEVADGHDPTDPNVLWELSTDDDIVLLFLTSDGTVASRAGYFEVDAASIPDCVGKIVMHKEKNGLALLAKSMPVLINGEFTGNLMVVKRIDREYEFLEVLARLLLALNVCGALIALGVGKLASQKMLAPLSAIIRKARSIDSRSLHTRVELPREDDELRLLAQTLNDMLDRVEDAFARQGKGSVSVPIRSMNGF